MNSTSKTDTLRAIRANILHCQGDPDDQPSTSNPKQALEYIEDGVLIIEKGLVQACGPSTSVAIPDSAVVHDFRGKLLVPGFVDTHVHYPQVDVIAAYGTQLLDWLERYTFPAEAQFNDEQHATSVAQFFLDELLKNGTTTALVFGTVHAASVDAFFTEASKRDLRMICGKVMMDRNAPPTVLDTAQSAYEDTKTLINRWHGKQRLDYAVTPRFAPTSSEAQLALAGQLLKEHPDVYLHTHMAENTDECDWVASLYPGHQDYLAVYEHFELVRKRSVFAHCIHLSDNAWKRMATADCSVAHCPCSNLFIGSGLFDLRSAQKHKIRVGLGSDIGGGDSFSILRNINEAYKIQQLQRHKLAPEQAFYMATLGGARALDLDDRIGNFDIGKEADFLIVDETATPLLKRRTQAQDNWYDRLFSLMMLGDDRCIERTFIMGEPIVYPSIE